jgi:hypothetical protein
MGHPGLNFRNPRLVRESAGERPCIDCLTRRGDHRTHAARGVPFGLARWWIVTDATRFDAVSAGTRTRLVEADQRYWRDADHGDSVDAALLMKVGDEEGARHYLITHSADADASWRDLVPEYLAEDRSA